MRSKSLWTRQFFFENQTENEFSPWLRARGTYEAFARKTLTMQKLWLFKNIFYLFKTLIGYDKIYCITTYLQTSLNLFKIFVNLFKWWRNPTKLLHHYFQTCSNLIKSKSLHQYLETCLNLFKAKLLHHYFWLSLNCSSHV